MTTFLPPAKLITPAFMLRPYTIGDGAALFEAVDASRAHLSPFIGWVERHVDVDASERDARAMAGRYLLETDFALAIERDGRMLGGTGFHLRGGALASGIAEIGMWIRASEAGRGLGEAVLRAMLDWGFTAWPFERFTWRCHTANVASRRVAEKCRLTLEGIARWELSEPSGGRADAIVFSAVRDRSAQAGGYVRA